MTRTSELMHALANAYVKSGESATLQEVYRIGKNGEATGEKVVVIVAIIENPTATRSAYASAGKPCPVCKGSGRIK